jgi:competence protein ComFC
MYKKIKNAVSSVLDFIYPRECLSCGKPLQEEGKICKACWDRIPVITGEHDLYRKTRSRLISDGIIDELVSCYIFREEGPFRSIAHAMKYREYKSCGFDLGLRMGNLLKEKEMEFDIIIPVPLHPVKLRERGYNQSEFIAKGVSKITGKPVEVSAVGRIRYTETQTKLNYERRRINMENAFRLLKNGGGKISGKKCLLIDDIITTGATMHSCAREIFYGGSISIISAAAAIAE